MTEDTTAHPANPTSPATPTRDGEWDAPTYTPVTDPETGDSDDEDEWDEGDQWDDPGYTDDDYEDTGDLEMAGWALAPQHYDDPFDVHLVLANTTTSLVVPLSDDLLETLIGVALDQNRDTPGTWPELDADSKPRARPLGKLSDATGWSATNRVWESLPPKVQFGIIAGVAALLLFLLTYSILRP